MGFFARLDDHLVLMSQMMEKVGVDLSLGAGPALETDFRLAVRNCMACPSTKTCRAWLAKAEKGVRPPGFCPNARRFETYIA